MVQIMACRLFRIKPLVDIMLAYCGLDPREQISVKIESNNKKRESAKVGCKLAAIFCRPQFENQ